MKKVLSMICVLLCMALLSAAAVHAETADSDDAGVYAVLELSSGAEVVVDAAPDAALISAVDGYELYIGDEPVMAVDRTLSGRGTPVETLSYYVTEFTIPGTAYDVLLAGLTEDKIEEIQQYIINNYVRGEAFNITDLSFIDAEKTYALDDGDENLCWAGTASNMLYYTGWAAQAGFENEDDLMEDFMAHFDDEGSHANNAMFWFFNSCSLGYRGTPYWAVFDIGSGGYLNDYAADMLCGMSLHNAQNIDESAQRLRNGCGVGLSMALTYEGDDNEYGHAVTLWGYIMDGSLPADDPARYIDIFIGDSDSYEGIIGDDDADRREAYNVLNVYPLTLGADGRFSFDYSGSCTSTITDYTYLVPYSADLPKETDPEATKDKANTPDLYIRSFDIIDDDETEAGIYETGSVIRCGFAANNGSDAAYTGRIDMHLVLTDAEGSVYLDETDSSSNASLHVNWSFFSDLFSTEPLPAGDYTLTCTLNPDRSAEGVSAEAYYYNNYGTASFKVRDAYLTGDSDGNGSVEITDATSIQRKIAGFGAGFDRMDERADINGKGLDIIDATIIQRHIAGFETGYPIGQKQFYQ